MIWHLLRIVFEVCFLRITDFNVLIFFFVRWDIIFLGLVIGITAVSFCYTSDQLWLPEDLIKYHKGITLILSVYLKYQSVYRKLEFSYLMSGDYKGIIFSGSIICIWRSDSWRIKKKVIKFYLEKLKEERMNNDGSLKSRK